MNTVKRWLLTTLLLVIMVVFGVAITEAATQGEWQNLVDDTRLTSNHSARHPSLGVDSSGNIHIAWQDIRDEGANIYYTKLDNNGNTLVDDTRLTSNGFANTNPSLGVDSSGNIHIAWQDIRDEGANIYYTKLDNNGNTLVDDTKITNYYNIWTRRNPSLGVDSSGNIHIAWDDSRPRNDTTLHYIDIYYTKLDNNGNTLVDDTQISDKMYEHYNTNPSLGVDSSGNIHILWEEEPFGLYYTKLDNDGNNLIYNKRILGGGNHNKYMPDLGVDRSGNIHIVRLGSLYLDPVQIDRAIFYAKLDNNGNILVSNTRLTSNDSASSPSLGVDSSGNIHIAWQDNRDGNCQYSYSTEGEIYYTKLDNNGNTLVDDTRLTSNSRASKNPSLGVDSSGNIHIAWRDDRDSDGEICSSLFGEIYYTKGKTTVLGGGCPNDGDVNLDSSITPQDALMAFQHYLGIIQLSDCQQDQADVNNDGSITPADALCIFQEYLGLPSCLE